MNQVDPDRIVYAIEENFKEELSKPKLRNLILTSIAVNGIIKRADYSELRTASYGGEKYPLMAVMDFP